MAEVSRPLVFRTRALTDVENAVDWYRNEAGAKVAEGFVKGLEAAYRELGRNPGGGSPRWGIDLDWPTLRGWPLRRFPFVVFYLEAAERVEVVRVLHGSRDIPATLTAGAIRS